MREAEQQWGRATPLLVHTDLFVVHDDLTLIMESFWAYQKLRPDVYHLNRLMLQNVITGCTVMINQALHDLSPTIPANATMHDWWLGLVAVAFGKVISLKKATISYRQHTDNVVGAKKWGISTIWDYFRRGSTIKRSIRKKIVQAESFFEHYHDRLSVENRDLVQQFIDLQHKNKAKKILSIIKNRFYMIGLFRNLGLFINI